MNALLSHAHHVSSLAKVNAIVNYRSRFARTPKDLKMLGPSKPLPISKKKRPSAEEIKPRSMKKPRVDKGKSRAYRCSVSTLASRAGKYGDLTLENITEMKPVIMLIADDVKRRKELNRLGALRSSTIRKLRLERDRQHIEKLQSILGDTLRLQDSLVCATTALVQDVEDVYSNPVGPNFSAIDNTAANIGDLFEMIGDNNNSISREVHMLNVELGEGKLSTEEHSEEGGEEEVEELDEDTQEDAEEDRAYWTDGDKLDGLDAYEIAGDASTRSFSPLF